MGAPEPPRLQVQGLQQRYGGSHILRDVGFEARSGEITTVLGRNGVGKTTLMKVLMGLVAPFAGQVTLDGQDLAGVGPHRRARLGVGYVPQGREIFSRLSVQENLAMGQAALARGAEPMPLEDLFALFPVLREMRSRRGGDLSGGQQQQLAIARALVARPRLLLLDEPTEGIQPSIIQEIGRVIRRLADTGTMAIVLVEQYVDFAAELADRYLVMERGEIVMRGAGADMGRDGVRQRLAI